MSRIVTPYYCSELTTVNPPICFLRTVAKANVLAQLSLRDFKEIISLMKESKETQLRKDY